LEDLTNGLGVSLANVFSGMEFLTSFDPLLRHAEQPVWQDPESGYIRRSLPPSGLENFNATGRSAFSRTCTRHLRHHAMQQPIWIITGQFEIQLGEQTYQLYQGDDLALCVDHPIIFINPNVEPYRYVLAIEDRKIPYNMRLTPAWNL
jgi:quercetin dioxygenase-like cupin family protein